MTVAEVPDAFVNAVTADAGVPLDPEWVDAFRSVPRPVFVPRFFAQNRELAWEEVRQPSPQWARQVWRNVPLITQLDGDDGLADRARDEPLRQGNATSSSSQPSLMAAMLQALDVREGQRVLEVGTGSGYNAALLCHRLGDTAVTTVDVDPGVTARASERLASVGLHPRVVTGDGIAGCQDDGPFDRIIATVGMQRLPSAWVTQVRPGGRILFPLDLRNQGGLLPLLTVRGHRASGPFLPTYGGFMAVREQGVRRDGAEIALRTVTDDQGLVSTTTVPDDAARGGTPAEFFVALRTGGYDWVGFTPSGGGRPESWFADGHGSWACHVTDRDGSFRVRHGGPRRLWTEVEDALGEWDALGRPSRDRFGLTMTADGTHRVWLDDPDRGPTWPL